MSGPTPNNAIAAADTSVTIGAAAPGLVSRSIAMLIDLGIIGVLALAAGAAVQLITLVLPKWVWLATAIPATVGATIAFLPLAYFSIAVAAMGRTLGKAVMGMHVVGRSGRRLPFTRSVLRTLAYVVSLIPLGAGFLWILVDRDRRAWHDHIAGSRVVFSPPSGG